MATVLTPISLSPVDTYENVDLNRGSFNDIRGRKRIEVSDAVQGRSVVILILGQSNGANSGSTPYTPKRRVFNFNLFDGFCYVAQDPLLGATETRGSFGSRLGDKLIDSGHWDTVVLAPISIGGSRIEEWTTGGVRHRRLQVAIQRAADSGLTFTHVLWHQGESNARSDADGDAYVECFLNIHAALRGYGVSAPIYVAQATICNSPSCEPIRRAQGAVVNPELGILSGPDTDLIGPDERFDGCHMNERGLERHAEMWLKVLLGEKTERRPRARECPSTR